MYSCWQCPPYPCKTQQMPAMGSTKPYTTTLQYCSSPPDNQEVPEAAAARTYAVVIKLLFMTPLLSVMRSESFCMMQVLVFENPGLEDLDNICEKLSSLSLLFSEVVEV